MSLTYHQKLARVLDAMGGVYLVDDLLTRINDGRMQSFTCNNSWAITEVQDFPRGRKMQIVALVGDLADGEALHEKVMSYADEVNAGLVETHGRKGWLRHALEHGWRVKAKNFIYQKAL